MIKGLTSFDAKIVLIEEALGSLPGDEKVYESFIASNAPDAKTREEEIAESSQQEVVDKGTTIFLKDGEGHPYLWDYQIKGFFKEAMKAMAEVKDSKCAQIKAYKKKIDNNVFVYPRKIPVFKQNGEQLTKDDFGICQRPLRAQTAQGERTALAISETIPEGSYFRITIKVLGDNKVLTEALKECLDYGELKGLLQWRNSGKGRFIWTEE